MRPRLRGGAKEKGKHTAIIEVAIENAAHHGINLHAGVGNLANGNCLFEAVIDSINIRDCFNEHLDESPNFYRNLWMSEVERVGYETWSNGLSKDQWNSNSI